MAIPCLSLTRSRFAFGWASLSGGGIPACRRRGLLLLGIDGRVDGQCHGLPWRGLPEPGAWIETPTRIILIADAMSGGVGDYSDWDASCTMVARKEGEIPRLKTYSADERNESLERLREPNSWRRRQKARTFSAPCSPKRIR